MLHIVATLEETDEVYKVLGIRKPVGGIRKEGKESEING